MSVPGLGAQSVEQPVVDREQALRELAAQLMFSVEKYGTRFSLCRDVDVPTAVRGDDLTLEEAEELLQTWKLRGFHGG